MPLPKPPSQYWIFLPIASTDTWICIQPKVVTDVDDIELQKKLEQLALMNEEVDGDDDNSDEYED